MKEKVFAYIRVSTMNQTRDGFSLEYQADEIKQFCEHNNYELLAVFEDAGVSGAKIDEDDLVVSRPELREMLARLQQEKVQYVMCLNTSRLWRSDTAKLLIQRVLRKNGVDVKSLEQPTYSIYSNDPSNVLINGIMEVLDEYARLEIALKLSRGRRKKAEKGLYAGGGVIYGYKPKKSDKTIEINEIEAQAVRRIFKLREQYPTISLTQIAVRINSEGYKTSKGMNFGKSQIKRILDHKSFYKGTYHYAEIEAKGQYVAII